MASVWGTGLAQGYIWVVVKIMVPFWILITTRQLIFRVPKKGNSRCSRHHANSKILLFSKSEVPLYTPMKHAALAAGAERLIQGFADGSELSASRMWDFCHMARETPIALVQTGGYRVYRVWGWGGHGA